MNTPLLTLVVAMDENGVIGRAGTLPWHLPADLAHFKRTTLGKPVLMGRRTFEEVGRPLPKRRNLVLSRSLESAPEGVELVRDLDEALALLADCEEVMIIGGGVVYREALPRAHRVVRTTVRTRVPDGDTSFPRLDPAEWRCIATRERPADEKNAHDLVFEVFVRRGGPVDPEVGALR